MKSKKELGDDETALQTFIANDEKERKAKSDAKKKAQKNRALKEDELKVKESQIQQIVSDIDKNKDALTELD